MKKLYGLLAALLIPALAGTVMAANLADLQVEALESFSMAEKVVGNDIVGVAGNISVTLYYVGSATESLVSISSYQISAQAPFGTTDTGFGSSGTYDWGVGGSASYDTIGELCTAIQALSSYNCSMRGAKNDDSSALLYDITAALGGSSLKAAGGYDVSFDTGGLSASVAYDMRVGITPQDGKRVILRQCVGNMNITTAGDLKVYGKLHKYATATDMTRNDATAVWDGTAATDDTDQTTSFVDSLGHGGLEFAENQHVVIAADSDATQAATNSLACFWSEK